MKDWCKLMSEPYRQPSEPITERRITMMQWIDGFDHEWIPNPPPGKGWSLRNTAAAPGVPGRKMRMPMTALLFFVWEREKETP